MADVFCTVVTPAALRAEALVVSNGAFQFSAKKTTDPTGNPPATHYMGSGLVPEESRDALANDGRFLVSPKTWQEVCLDMGLYTVIEEL